MYFVLHCIPRTRPINKVWQWMNLVHINRFTGIILQLTINSTTAIRFSGLTWSEAQFFTFLDSAVKVTEKDAIWRIRCQFYYSNTYTNRANDEKPWDNKMLSLMSVESIFRSLLTTRRFSALETLWLCAIQINDYDVRLSGRRRSVTSVSLRLSRRCCTVQ